MATGVLTPLEKLRSKFIFQNEEMSHTCNALPRGSHFPFHTALDRQLHLYASEYSIDIKYHQISMNLTNQRLRLSTWHPNGLFMPFIFSILYSFSFTLFATKGKKHVMLYISLQSVCLYQSPTGFPRCQRSQRIHLKHGKGWKNETCQTSNETTIEWVVKPWNGETHVTWTLSCLWVDLPMVPNRRVPPRAGVLSSEKQRIRSWKDPQRPYHLE